MPIIRKYKTKDGSIKQKTYTTVRGQRAESYRREQNRQYRTKIRQLQPPRQRVYPPSQADTLPLATVHQIIDEYKQGVSQNKLIGKELISKFKNEIKGNPGNLKSKPYLTNANLKEHSERECTTCNIGKDSREVARKKAAKTAEKRLLKPKGDKVGKRKPNMNNVKKQ